MHHHHANARAVQKIQIMREGGELALIDQLTAKRHHEGTPAEGMKVRRGGTYPGNKLRVGGGGHVRTGLFINAG